MDKQAPKQKKIDRCKHPQTERQTDKFINTQLQDNQPIKAIKGTYSYNWLPIGSNLHTDKETINNKR